MSGTDRKRGFGATVRSGALPGGEASGVTRRPWRRIVEALGVPRGWCCECTDRDAGPEWDVAAAPYVLREAEWRIWNRQPRPDLRARWMRGRVAAKDAVRRLLFDRHGLVAPMETIGIVPNERGQPRVACAALPGADLAIAVSITHCGAVSVALAIESKAGRRGVGIDVECEGDNHDGLADGGFARCETELLGRSGEPEFAEWLLRLWCAKEAVAKAMGLGLMGDPLNYIVRDMDREHGTIVIEANVRAFDGATPPGRVTARVGSDRGRTFAVAGVEGD